MQNDKSAVTIFDSKHCRLGEAAFWYAERECFLWLDILQKVMFEKSEAGNLVEHKFDFTPSAIIPSLIGGGIQIISDKGLISYDFQSGEPEVRKAFNLPNGFRTNDAALDPLGRVVFGTMEWHPTGQNGRVFRVEEDGKLTTLVDNIGIPNTFVWSSCGRKVYFADSYVNTMYVANYSEAGISNVLPLYQFPRPQTPDGSCVYGGKIINAVWGGARLAVVAMGSGEAVGDIQIPALQPTSCAVGGVCMKKLLVTSACVDMDESQLAQYPLSGNTFLLDIA